MAITLKNLVWADTPDDKRTICHGELCCVGPIAWTVEHEGSTIDIQLSDVSVTEANGNELLSVTAHVKRDGVDMFVDNPLLYLNPPICVPDGTTHTRTDAVTGATWEADNFTESPAEALKNIVFETLKVTVLK